MKGIILSTFLCFLGSISAQSNIWENADSLNTKRTLITSSSVFSLWTGSAIGLSQIWYKDYPKSKFHTFNDADNWLQMDKMGHIYTANKISGLTTDLMRWSGLKNNTASWIGFGVGLGYQTTFEILDGYSQAWGFSWSDMTANALGSALHLGQNLAWGEERFILKFSYHPTEFAALRPNVLGSTQTERFLKDYNGQTYWLSFSPFAFTPHLKKYAWICLSLGYSAHEKIIGDEAIYVNTEGNASYHASREFICSLDIDFSKLPIQKKWLKTLVSQFNYIKIPFPAVRFTKGISYGHYLYF